MFNEFNGLEFRALKRGTSPSWREAVRKISHQPSLPPSSPFQAAPRGEGKRTQRIKHRRRYGPFTQADLPEEGTPDYYALLLGFFKVDNAEEWRADWTLPDEVWARLEAEYEALK